MLYGEFIDELIARVGETNADRNIFGRKINASYKEVANIAYVNWEPLKRYGEIVTVPNYTTGTCTITAASRTVTFSGSSLTSAMEGRFFQPQGSSNWYKIIKVVSSSQCTLYSPIVETTAGGQTFKIWKRYYYFPSEVRRVLDFGSWIRDGILTDRSNQYLADLDMNLSLEGDPTEFSMFGVDPFEGTYSTGTVALTTNSDLATGSGTSWLGNIEPGDSIQVGTITYHVKRVEADDSIRLLNFSTQTLTAQTYTVRRSQNLGFQLWYNPNQAIILPYYYIKRVYDMVNEDYDRMELPDEFDKAVLDGAEADRMTDVNDVRWVGKVQLYNARLNDLKSSRFVSQPRTRQFRPLITDRGSYY